VDNFYLEISNVVVSLSDKKINKMENLEKPQPYVLLSYADNKDIPYTVTDEFINYEGDDEVTFIRGSFMHYHYREFLSKMNIDDVTNMLFNLFGGQKEKTQCAKMINDMYVKTESTRLIDSKTITSIRNPKLINNLFLLRVNSEDLDLIEQTQIKFNTGDINMNQIKYDGVNTIHYEPVKEYWTIDNV